MTAISFELEPPTEDEFRRRISSALQRRPWLVCEASETVLGYAYAGQYRPRAAYQWSVEVTVYVNAVYESPFECLRVQGYYSAYAAIALPNPTSIALHERLGFKPVGVYSTVGYKLGRWHDVGWWQLALQEPVPSPTPPPPLPDVTGTPQWTEALNRGIGGLSQGLTKSGPGP